MKYKFKEKAFSAVSAQIIGETINDLIRKKRGKLKPINLVDAARPKKSPIHSCFEWNDGVAAEKYRQTQASYLIRNIEFVQEVADDAEPIMLRPFVSVGDEGDRYYTTIQMAVDKPETYEQLLERAKGEYKALFAKYKDLKEFREINNAIKKLG